MELHVTKRKGREIVVLLDNDMRIVKPVYDYLKYQDQRDRAINTLIAYGNDLKAFWEFLSDYGYAYDEVSPKMIGEYKEYLMSEDDNIIAINKEGARTAKTINRMLSTLHGFYQYKADMQEIDNPLLMHEVNRPFNAFKGILEHARSDNKTKQSIFKVKESNYKINLVSDDEMELFLSRLDKRRDILLYKMLYLTGARIQEVLDLEIESVPVPDMSQHYGRNFKFDFSYISSDEIKELFKDYVWQNYRVGNKTLSSLYREVNSYFYRFIQFAESRNIISLKGLTNVDVENYISYLHTTISEKTGKPYGISMQRHSLFALKSVIRWCQLHRPDDAPVTEIFTGSEYTGVNRKLKIDFIPDDVVAQINEALKTEENQYLKYGIIILQSTGMRIGDLLKLRIDCIKPHPISGYTIEWVQHKGRKNKAPMPVRSECVAAIEKLIEITKELRDEADEKDKDTLMIWRVSKGNRYIQQGTVQVVSKGTFANYWFKKFIKDNDIKDANGDYYNLTSHQFRRTLGTDMLSKGTNINVIQQVLGHSDASVTKRFYADVKDKERAEVFKSVGVIGNINQIQSNAFDNISEFEWFKANKDKGACMCDGYCTKPVIDGKICDRLLKRQKCYTCSRYITTPEYLDAHKRHLANLEKQLEEGVIYGEHYAEHFIPTIEVLKVIIERLEGLQNGN